MNTRYHLRILVLLIGFLIFIQPHLSQALNERSSFKDIRYQPAKSIPSPDAPELKQIAGFIESQGLYDVSHGLRGFRQRFGLDQVFVSRDLSRAVFLRFDVTPASGKDDGRIATDGTDTFVAHGKTHQGTSYTAMFRGYNRSAINPVLFGLQKDLSGFKRSSSKTSFLHLLIPSSHADDGKEDDGEEEKSEKKSTCTPNSILNRGWGPLLKSLGWKCVYDAVSAGKYLPLAAKWGVSGVALGAMETVGDESIKGSVQKGIDGSFLDAAKKHFDTFVANLKNIRSVLKENLNAIDMLSDEEQQTIWCRLAGLAAATGGSAALVSAGSGGAAAPIAFIGATAIMEAYTQLTDVQESLEKVRKQCKIPKSEEPTKWVDPPKRAKAVK